MNNNVKQIKDPFDDTPPTKSSNDVKMVLAITRTKYAFVLWGNKKHYNYWDSRFTDGRIRDWVKGKGIPKTEGVYELTMSYVSLSGEAIESGEREYTLISTKRLV